MAIDRDFWKGKTVLVTGHTGFKGAWLSLWLQSLGARVIGYALAPPTSPSLFEVACVAEGITSILGDIRDYKLLSSTIVKFRPEIVVHMAAQPLVRLSYIDPVETYAVNVMGTVSVMEAVRANPGPKAVIVVTTDKCYENREWVWGYRENDGLGGYDPYSSSKACAELTVAAYRNSFFNPARFDMHGLALASVRAGNVIGGGDWAVDRLIPDIVRAFAAGKTPVIRNPAAVRPWQHVLEPLSGYLVLAQKLYLLGPKFGSAWNFGPSNNDEQPVSNVVDQVASQWGEGANWRVDSSTHPHEAHYLKLDCSKARSELGWVPRWGLSTGLQKTVAWYKAHKGGENMRAFSVGQIMDYSAGSLHKKQMAS